MAGELELKTGSVPNVSSGSLVDFAGTDLRRKTIAPDGTISTLNNIGMQQLNVLNNPGFLIQQRVATAATAIPAVSLTTRAGQVADRWAVTVGNVTTPLWTQVDSGSAVETGLISKFYGRITQNTNAAKFIFSQFLANDQMAHLRGSQVRVSCKIKQFVGSNANYRLGLLQLTSAGTIDVCPAFISAIGGASVEPTWGTNLAAITPDASPTGENGTISGVALTIASTAAWVRSSAVFTVPTNAKNLCMVLYRDTIGAASDSLGVAEFQLTQGPDICEYVELPPHIERLRCQRFFCKSFQATTVPAQNAGVVNAVNGIIGKATAVALAAKIPIRFPVTMFKSPVVTLYNPSAANAQVRRIDGTTPADQTATAQLHLGDSGLLATATGDAAGAIGDTIAVHYTAEAEFIT
jgi:hypothetical protein